MAGRVRLSAHRYGKDGIRLVRVARGDAEDRVWDLTVRVRLEGDFGAAYEAGSNAGVLPTDTMRSTVYALAARDWQAEIEAFAAVVGRRLLDACPAARLAAVEVEEHPWRRLAPAAFARAGPERWTAEVRLARGGEPEVTSGLAGLRVLKTSGSAFEDFLRDEFTVLEASADRLLATEVAARWEYGRPAGDHAGCREAVRRALVGAFAGHESRSVQHTLYAMAEAALAARPELSRISLTMPNLHHVPLDLSPFGLENANEVFVATDRPFGVIEGTVERSP